jgi:hypothetical protein
MAAHLGFGGDQTGSGGLLSLGSLGAEAQFEALQAVPHLHCAHPGRRLRNRLNPSKMNPTVAFVQRPV